jgi:hypothetical protein
MLVTPLNNNVFTQSIHLKFMKKLKEFHSQEIVKEQSSMSQMTFALEYLLHAQVNNVKKYQFQ